jgi:hypothetical protein
LLRKPFLPVIGVPIDSSPLRGLDALLSTSMMPAGVPVRRMAIGKQGAGNAAILAAQILARSDPALAKRLYAYKTARGQGGKSDVELRSRMSKFSVLTFGCRCNQADSAAIREGLCRCSSDGGKITSMRT